MTQFETDLVALLPELRSTALGLARNRADADDLVQETVVRALAHRNQFRPGTRMGAWLYVIMVNAHRADHRRRRRWVADPDGVIASVVLGATAGPEAALLARDDLAALERIPARSRDALVRFGRGDAYGEIAAAAGVPIGTVKSRINRARAEFAAAIG